MDKTKVLELAELSKLAVTESEAEIFASEMTDVLGMIDKLHSFNNSAFTHNNTLEFEQLREDIPEGNPLTEKITKASSFTVPKVV